MSHLWASLSYHLMTIPLNKCSNNYVLIVASPIILKDNLGILKLSSTIIPLIFLRWNYIFQYCLQWASHVTKYSLILPCHTSSHSIHTTFIEVLNVSYFLDTYLDTYYSFTSLWIFFLPRELKWKLLHNTTIIRCAIKTFRNKFNALHFVICIYWHILK